MAQSIEYYFSVLSPFTYLAGTRLETIAARHGASIQYRPCDIAKILAETGGLPVPQRHPSRLAYRAQELQRIAKRNKMPITLQPAHWPTNPVPASAALISAQEAGHSIGLVAHALLRAVWAEEKDIAEETVLEAAFAAHGVSFDTGAVFNEAVLSTYERNTRQAVDAGVFGAPFYIVGEQRFWGQDRLGDLDDCLAEFADA